jgi:hypothetical protein
MKKLKLLLATLLFCTANLYAMEEEEQQHLIVLINNQQDQINNLTRRLEIQEEGLYINLQKKAVQNGRSAVLKLALSQEALGVMYVTLGYLMNTYNQLTPSDHQGEINDQRIPQHSLINTFGWVFEYEGILSMIHGAINLTTLPTNSINNLTKTLNEATRLLPSLSAMLHKIFHRQ